MKKMSLKKGLIIMIVLAILFIISSKVLATGTSDGPIGINIQANPTTTNTETNTESNTTTNEVTQPTINTAATPTNTQGSTYQNTALPQTGDASDYAIFMLIVVAIVVAIYAYKKVREYNIK